MQRELPSMEEEGVGDLLYFPKGSTITFSTPDFGVGYFCSQRGEGEA